MKNGQIIMTNLKCEECDNIFRIPRGKGEKRDKGHIKHVWCFKCKKTTAHRDFIYDHDVIGTYALTKDEIKELEVAKK